MQNKDDYSVGWKTCCRANFDLHCVRKYSAESDDGIAPTTASVECDAGYRMVGCSGYGIYHDLNSFWIHRNDHKCFARGASRADANKVYAIAIWYVLAFISVSIEPFELPQMHLCLKYDVTTNQP